MLVPVGGSGLFMRAASKSQQFVARPRSVAGWGHRLLIDASGWTVQPERTVRDRQAGVKGTISHSTQNSVRRHLLFCSSSHSQTPRASRKATSRPRCRTNLPASPICACHSLEGLLLSREKQSKLHNNDASKVLSEFNRTTATTGRTSKTVDRGSAQRKTKTKMAYRQETNTSDTLDISIPKNDVGNTNALRSCMTAGYC